ncbi:SpcZ [Nocardia brasiliensis]|uniref:SpcZ n=1 Tax=Nocardia brasiliensis TaxID=37326 RepID=UPI001893E6DC|nr:SpcZ [Nocardia brasiliensis]MBF6129640.1 SpcZ [Nocardia brasiliensis]
MTADRSVPAHSGAPTWLGRIVEMICVEIDSAAAQQWRQRIDAELPDAVESRTLAVVHDWYAHSIGPQLVAASARWTGSPQAQVALRALHVRAVAGERIAETEWAAALEPALRQVYRQAYPYAHAYAAAAADANSYAVAHGYAAAEARSFGDSYAEMNTEANARVHAEANAAANAAATAAAFAADDVHAYDATYPLARIRAGVLACAGDDPAGQRAIWHRLAAGLADSLARAGLSSPSADRR